MSGRVRVRELGDIDRRIENNRAEADRLEEARSRRERFRMAKPEEVTTNGRINNHRSRSRRR